ncbi:MAG: hypothetical protein ACK5MV_13495 [Aminipila sp.]
MSVFFQLLPLIVYIIILVLIVRFIISYIRKSWGIDEIRQQSNEILKKVNEMQIKMDTMQDNLKQK